MCLSLVLFVAFVYVFVHGSSYALSLSLSLWLFLSRLCLGVNVLVCLYRDLDDVCLRVPSLYLFIVRSVCSLLFALFVLRFLFVSYARCHAPSAYLGLT